MAKQTGDVVGGLLGLSTPDTSATDKLLNQEKKRSESERITGLQTDLKRRTEDILRTFGRRNRFNGSFSAPAILGL
jgi:hypothetical protein